MRLYIDQLRELTLSEWKLREQSSLSGFLWTCLNPALTYAVLYWVFKRWNPGAADYPAKLIIGVVQYGFFNAATTYGMTSILRRRHLMLNFAVPREILVFSSVLSVALSYALEFSLMLLFLIVLGVVPGWGWLAVPAILALSVLLACATALILTILSARFPDFDRIWGLVVMAGFFLTPVFYTFESLDPGQQAWMRWNPVSQIIQVTRSLLLGASAPVSGALLGLTLLVFLSAAAGYALFRRERHNLADYALRY